MTGGESPAPTWDPKRTHLSPLAWILPTSGSKDAESVTFHSIFAPFFIVFSSIYEVEYINVTPIAFTLMLVPIKIIPRTFYTKSICKNCEKTLANHWKSGDKNLDLCISNCIFFMNIFMGCINTTN